MRNAASLLLTAAVPSIAKDKTKMNVCLYADDALSRYGFPEGHPFGIDRQDAFLREAKIQGLLDRVRLQEGRAATRDALARFHQAEYVDLVRTAAL